jgi:hypothetical protein
MNEDKSKAAKVRGIKKSGERDAKHMVQSFMLGPTRAPCSSVLEELQGPIPVYVGNARGQYV